MMAASKQGVVVIVVMVMTVSLLHAAPQMAPFLAAGLVTKEDASLCGKLDTPADCASKVGQCAPLDTILGSLTGSPKDVLTCVNSTGVTKLTPGFLAKVGSALVLGGAKKTLGDKVTTDPIDNLAIKQCVLNATGLLGADYQVNRTAVAGRVSALSPPDLGAAVAAAARITCPPPPPTTLATTPYLKCLKKACVMAATPPAPTLPMPLN